MTHAKADLTPFRYNNALGGGTWWHCVTADNRSSVVGANYFDLSNERLKAGDWIFISAGDGACLYTVASVTSGAVALGRVDIDPAAATTP